MSPFSLITEVREFWDGPIILSGAMSKGEHILAALAMGADMAYMGTRFIASQEAVASEAYKQSLVKSHASDIIYTNFFTGVHGNYLRSSIESAGLDPDNLPEGELKTMNFSGTTAKAWRDIWGAGQSVSGIKSVESVQNIVDKLYLEFTQAKSKFN